MDKKIIIPIIIIVVLCITFSCCVSAFGYYNYVYNVPNKEVLIPEPAPTPIPILPSPVPQQTPLSSPSSPPNKSNPLPKPIENVPTMPAPLPSLPNPLPSTPVTIPISKPPVPAPTPSKGGIGAKCTIHEDCLNYGPGPTDVACCDNFCTRKMKDWAGIGYCPNICQDAPSPLGKPGTCGSGNTWPRSEGQKCDVHEACKGYGSGPTDMACCDNICTRKMKDWANIGYCPNICQDAPSPLGQPGTCGSGNTWPRSEGQKCDVHEACKGYGPGPNDMACCDRICTRKKTDFVGVGYCPQECRGGPFLGSGTC